MAVRSLHALRRDVLEDMALVCGDRLGRQLSRDVDEVLPDQDVKIDAGSTHDAEVIERSADRNLPGRKSKRRKCFRLAKSSPPLASWAPLLVACSS